MVWTEKNQTDRHNDHKITFKAGVIKNVEYLHLWHLYSLTANLHVCDSDDSTFTNNTFIAAMWLIHTVTIKLSRRFSVMMRYKILQ